MTLRRLLNADWWTHFTSSESLPPYPTIAAALKRGEVVPFLGSAASTAEGRKAWIPMPSNRDLACHVAQAAGLKYPEEWDDLAKVSSYYRHMVADRGDLSYCLREVLDRHIAPPFFIHRTLAELDNVRLILTTNYDSLLEDAFDECGRRYDLLVYAPVKDRQNTILWKPWGGPWQRVRPNRIPVDLTTTTVIFKMHGSVRQIDGEVTECVISEEDYADFLSRNTAIPRVVVSGCEGKHMLFLGHSLRDWNVRVLLIQLRKLTEKDRERRHWAIFTEKSTMELRLWDKRMVAIFPVELLRFIKHLRQSLGLPSC